MHSRSSAINLATNHIIKAMKFACEEKRSLLPETTTFMIKLFPNQVCEEIVDNNKHICNVVYRKQHFALSNCTNVVSYTFVAHEMQS